VTFFVTSNYTTCWDTTESVRPRTTEAERAAHNNRSIASRETEFMGGLHVELGREPFGGRSVLAESDHVLRYVRAVYVQAQSKIGNEQTPVPQATSSAG
jgi:hypothetical protein